MNSTKRFNNWTFGDPCNDMTGGSTEPSMGMRVIRRIGSSNSYVNEVPDFIDDFSRKFNVSIVAHSPDRIQLMNPDGKMAMTTIDDMMKVKQIEWD